MQASAPSGGRNPGYDVLRGIAILGVLCVHAAEGFLPSGTALSFVAGLGRFGVQLFYIVSAMTMCMMWDQRLGEPSPVARFYIRRFFRIAPMFWLAIAVYLAINGVGPSYWSPEGIHAHQVALTATFTHGFWPDAIDSVVPGGWSIAVEMTFYAFFPWLLARASATTVLWAAVIIYFADLFLVNPALAGVFSGRFPDYLVRDFAHLNIVAQLPVFLLGVFLYRLNSDPAATQARVLIAGLGLWLVAAWAACYLTNQPPREALFVVVIQFLCALAWATMRLKPRAVLLEKLGRNSYAIYLGHAAMLFIVQAAFAAVQIPDDGIGPFVAGLVLLTGLSYAFSLLSFHLVEGWTQRLGHRLAESVERT